MVFWWQQPKFKVEMSWGGKNDEALHVCNVLRWRHNHFLSRFLRSKVTNFTDFWVFDETFVRFCPFVTSKCLEIHAKPSATSKELLSVLRYLFAPTHPSERHLRFQKMKTFRLSTSIVELKLIEKKHKTIVFFTVQLWLQKLRLHQTHNRKSMQEVTLQIAADQTSETKKTHRKVLAQIEAQKPANSKKLRSIAKLFKWNQFFSSFFAVVSKIHQKLLELFFDNEKNKKRRKNGKKGRHFNLISRLLTASLEVKMGEIQSTLVAFRG